MRGFHPTTLTVWRNRLRVSDRPQRIFEAVREVVAATGVLKGKTRRALDSVVLDDAVATRDTVTQLIAAVRRVRREVPAAAEVIAARCHAHDWDDAGKPQIETSRCLPASCHDTRRWPRTGNRQPDRPRPGCARRAPASETTSASRTPRILFHAMDPPEHGAYRRLASHAFTPRALYDLHEDAAEADNLSAIRPEDTERLRAMVDKWCCHGSTVECSLLSACALRYR
jgi:hypothetical protein